MIRHSRLPAKNKGRSHALLLSSCVSATECSSLSGILGFDKTFIHSFSRKEPNMAFSKQAAKDGARADVYTRVTSEIVTAIEAGTDSWVMPWHTAGSGFPVNALTGKAYRGINILTLWAQAHSKGYHDPKWATYQQWSQLGMQVASGAKASTGVVWKHIDRTENDDDPHSRFAFARAFSLFNACQIEGYVPADWPATPPKPRIEQADEFFSRLGADLRHGGTKAFYSPTKDYVNLPPFEAFGSAEGYYATLAHEMTHWTAHSSRMDRDLTGRFGDSKYAAEELIAELGASFLCADLYIPTSRRDDHASYIQSWLSLLGSDSRAIFTAASHAQRAADYMHGLITAPEPDPVPRASFQPALIF
jgi:antirestriction protein ArdC